VSAAEPGRRSLSPGVVRTVVRALIRPALSLPLPHRMRRGWFELLGRLADVPEQVALGAETLGGVPAERLDPPGDSHGSVLYLHGGGFVFGSPRTHRSITARLAVSSGATVHALDYRLAPEHPFPAALDDALAAYRALDAPVALAGDSAGAKLAVAVALRARDEGLPAPDAICLLCPLLDLESNGSRAGHDSDAGLPRVFVERGAVAYLADGDPRHPHCAPLHADLADLPPVLVHAAGTDILRPDAESFAERAHEAGTAVELRLFDGLWHDFHAQAGALAAADTALAEAGEFLRSALTRPRA
jgi:monoterpene epsilon-lactone hydrolase